MSVKLNFTNFADLFNGSSTSLLPTTVITIIEKVIAIEPVWLCFVC